MTSASTRPARASGRLEVIELEGVAQVAERVASRLVNERRQRPDRPLGLATGRTMEPVFDSMVRQLMSLGAPERDRLCRDWLSFNLDEYVGLGPGDPRSFAAAMRIRLVDPLALNPRTVRLPDGLAPDPQEAARDYASEVAAAGGIGLQLLGLGLNGHVGFNEPPCAADQPCRCVALSPSTRSQNAALFGDDPAAVPDQAITLGIVEILAARRILLVVTGAAKAPVLRRVLEEPPTSDLPASWLQTHPQVTVIADGAALGR